MISPNTSSFFAPLRLAAYAVVVAVILSTLAGCRSNTVVLDNRPAWVVEAEQRLQRDPVASVDKSEERASRPLWESQPTNEASKPQESSTARQRRSTAAAQATSPTASQPSATSSPAAQPAGVSWGETKITVEVED